MDGPGVRGRRLSSGNLAVLLTWAVAVLSVLTGLANIGTTGLDGPLSTVVPPAIQRTAGFSGTLTGFLMVASAYGMRRRLRAAWYTTAVLLPVAAVQGVAQSTVLSVPLVALSLAALPPTVFARGQFDRHLDLSTTQVAAAGAIVALQVYGTVGTYVLRDEFQNVYTVLDAFYYTLVTASTVGYGDAAPTSQAARLFGLSVVVFGTASFAAALGALVVPAIEARVAGALGRHYDRQLRLMENHVIVLGYGDLTAPLLNELVARPDVDVVVVTADERAAARLGDRDVAVVTGDPSDESALGRAEIEDARAVVAATNDDGADALAVLTASQLNSDARVVAAATDRENVEKLRRAGADTVISPAEIGGHLLVLSAMGEEGTEEMVEGMLARETLDGDG
jgi:voltage-gated potassium channel